MTFASKQVRYPMMLGVGVILGLTSYGLWRVDWSAASGQDTPKVVCYQDSMHPWIKSDKPGKCTICGMDLTPIYEGRGNQSIDANMVVLSSNSISVLNVQTQEVKRQPLCRTLHVAGRLDADESHKVVIAAPAVARIESTSVAYAGVEIQKGQPLITLFSPDLVQKGRLLLAAAALAQNASNLDVAVAAQKANPFSSVLAAPISGTVIERLAYPGQFVAEGEKLLTIVDPSILWFRFDIYEEQLPWCRLGQKIDVTVPAVPEYVFRAVIKFIEPTISEATRTVKVRADLQNPLLTINGEPQRLLRFGMYAEGRVACESPAVLAVPRTAVLFCGGAPRAYVDKGGGAYEMRRLRLGRQGDMFREVLHGLDEGDRIVTSGNVLIDAQAQFNQGQSTDTAPAQNDEVIDAPREQMAHMPAAQDTAPNNVTRCLSPELGALVYDVPATGPLVSPMNPRPATQPAGGAALGDQNAVTANPQLKTFRAQRQMMEAMKHAAEANTDHPDAAREMASTQPAISPPTTAPSEASPRAGSHEPQPPDVAITASQRQVLKDFINEVSGIGQALASDSVELFNDHIPRLSAVLPRLQEQFANPSLWQVRIEPLAGLKGTLEPAKDLAAARQQFLGLSTAAVELAKELKKEDSEFATLKLYHCPMAPKPGNWIQTQGPLRNPFFGSQMLTCGTEVRP